MFVYLQMLRSCLEPSGTGSLNSILMRSRAPSWRPFSTRGVTFPCPTQSDWWQPCWIYRSVQKLSEHVLIGWNKKWFANCNRMKGSMWFRRCECSIERFTNLNFEPSPLCSNKDDCSKFKIWVCCIGKDLS